MAFTYLIESNHIDIEGLSTMKERIPSLSSEATNLSDIRVWLEDLDDSFSKATNEKFSENDFIATDNFSDNPYIFKVIGCEQDGYIWLNNEEGTAIVSSHIELPHLNKLEEQYRKREENAFDIVE